MIFAQMVGDVAFSYSEHHSAFVFDKVYYVLSPHNICKFIDLSRVNNKKLFI